VDPGILARRMPGSTLGPTQVCAPIRYLDRFIRFFAGLMVVINKQTDRQTDHATSVAIAHIQHCV